MNNNNQTPPPNQPPSPQQYYYPDDEISLIDLWNTLMRRKVVIIGTLIVVILAAVIYLMLEKPVYESRAIVEIAEVDGKVVENIHSLKQRLLSEYSGTKNFSIGSLNTEPEGIKNSIEIVSRADSASEAAKSIDYLVQELKEDHEEKYRDSVSRLEQRKKALESDIQGYREQLAELDLLIKNMQGSDAGHLALQMVNRGNVRDTVVELEKELNETQSILADATATHVIGTKLTKEKPVEPKPKLVIALSIVLGLMLGVFAAFFTEFIARARAEE